MFLFDSEKIPEQPANEFAKYCDGDDQIPTLFEVLPNYVGAEGDNVGEAEEEVQCHDDDHYLFSENVVAHT